MEIIIAIAVFGFGLWWVFVRTPADTTTSAAPYKVETPPTPEPIPAFDIVPPPELSSTVVVEGAGVVEVAAAPAEAAPVKKPRKPRAPKAVVAEKPAAKKAAPVKKAAAIKAAPKKTTPKSKKA